MEGKKGLIEMEAMMGGKTQGDCSKKEEEVLILVQNQIIKR